MLNNNGLDLSLSNLENVNPNMEKNISQSVDLNKKKIKKKSQSSSLVISSDNEKNDINTILMKENSNLWTVRMECFQELKSLLLNSTSAFINLYFEKIITVSNNHLHDPHYKVIDAVLEVLKCLLQLSTKLFYNSLEKILPNLLQKLHSNNKQNTRNLSTNLLKNIVENYEPDILLPIFLKMLEQPIIRVKIISLQYINQLIPNSEKYLKNINSNILFN